MEYSFTPIDAQPIADIMISFFRRRRFNTVIEKPISTAAPYTTTVVARKTRRNILIDAQNTPRLSIKLKELAHFLAINRINFELYIATYTNSRIKVGFIEDLKRYGMGLFQIDENHNVMYSLEAINYALVINPDPTLPIGNYKDRVDECFTKFNNNNRKDGLRDLCELVEGETIILALKTLAKRYLKASINETKIRNDMDWSGRIDLLASPNSYRRGKKPIIDRRFKGDQHSFRDARNLVDHAVLSRREETQRQKQYVDKMLLGARMISQLLSVKRAL